MKRTSIKSMTAGAIQRLQPLYKHAVGLRDRGHGQLAKLVAEYGDLSRDDEGNPTTSRPELVAIAAAAGTVAAEIALLRLTVQEGNYLTGACHEQLDKLVELYEGDLAGDESVVVSTNGGTEKQIIRPKVSWGSVDDLLKEVLPDDTPVEGDEPHVDDAPDWNDTGHGSDGADQ